MKKWFIAALMIAGLGANAQQKQSLKDLLYGGKLKKDSTSVIRKDDDLSARIDTATQKPVVAQAPVANTAPMTTSQVTDTVQTVAVAAETASDETVAAEGPTSAASATPAPSAPAKSNTKIWKEYTDSLTAVLKSEVLSNKKIKKETYYMMVEYEIEPTGAVNVLNVVSTPENDLLQAQVRDRLMYNPPALQPALDSAGKPRKVKRKQNFSITKD